MTILHCCASCNQYAAELKRLRRELAEAQRDAERAIGHLRDVLAADDGQAWKEARRFLEGIDAAINSTKGDDNGNQER
jgi:hypothetical protein